ncbi:hypothetical protein HK098_000215 [Nowakowskiella sp. JEL0407]|nr:hypothetical protein HK098_000215 [Nowakowskiella sp. JEL0407]
MSWGADLTDFDEANGWDRLMALNVKSIFYLTTALLPLLKNASKGNLDPSRVVNISSVSGIVPDAQGALSSVGNGIWSYAASKAAVNHLTRTLAFTLAGDHITVNAIAPGVFPSKMTRFGLENARDELLSVQPTGRVGLPEDIAGTLLFLVGKGGAHITGAVIPVDGGFILNKPIKSKL